MDRYDFVAATGLVTLTGGLWLLEPWVSLTVAGLLLIVIGVAGGVFAARDDTPDAAGGDA